MCSVLADCQPTRRWQVGRRIGSVSTNASVVCRWCVDRRVGRRVGEASVGSDSLPLPINLFRKNIACGPEYVHVCTSCDQMWYKCSVVKCNPNKYKACSPDIVESSLTGFKSVSHTKWICITNKSSLKRAGYPAVLKPIRWVFIISLMHWI